jgi:uncharacterized lipoprotein YmbA
MNEGVDDMKRHLFLRFTAVVALVSMTSLAGCGSTSPSSFYLLEAMPDSLAAGGDTEGPVIAIGPISVPDYLNRPQIVSRKGETGILLAEYDRWAEPLQDSFTRVMALNLGHLLSTDRLTLFPWQGSMPLDYRISVNVFRFDCDEEGPFVLSARWTLFGEDGKEVIAMRKSTFQKSLEDPYDYDAMVSAASEAVADLTREIASAIKG